MPSPKITQVGQRRGNKRFPNGKQIQQFSTVLDDF